MDQDTDRKALVDQGIIKAKEGRPSKKTPLAVEKVMQLAKEGKTEKEIANIIGVDQSTLTYWKATDFEFSTSLKYNKQLADLQVEASLFKKSVGFNYHEQFLSKDGIVELRKYSQPDTGAIALWLTNRKPKKWKRQVDPQYEAKNTVVLNIGDHVTNYKV